MRKVSVFLVTNFTNRVSMPGMKKALLLITFVLLASAATPAQDLSKQEAQVIQLRQLFLEGLVPRNEWEKAEQELASAKAKAEETRLQLENAEKLAAEMKKAEQLAKAKPLVKLTSMSLNKTATIMRSTAGNWSIGNLGAVQQFFSNTFGRPLPTSTIGQSATHNRLGWDHRNSVDVGVHPDSAEGRALIAYLQNAGIPFLAFRGAVPGVSTGPHIHIGRPSNRL